MSGVIHTDAAPAPVGAYPHARRVGDLLFLSGVGPRQPGSNAIPGNVHDANGVARYPVGILPVMDPETGETLVDELGRRSFTTSIAYGPTIGKNIALAYLPWSYAQEGRKLKVEYFGETYPVEVAGVGYKPLYDAENLKPRS